MKGLLSQAEADPQGDVLPQGGEQVALDSGESQASPEEEALMEQALLEVGKMIYGSDSAADALLETIAAAEKPQVGIGLVVSQVVDVADQKMDLPEDFILPLGEAVTYMVIEMADKAGLTEASDDLVELSLMESAKNLAEDFDVGAEGMELAMQDRKIGQEVQRVGERYAEQQ